MTLVDTPGFDDTRMTDVDVLCALARWLEETYIKGCRLSGLLYLHRITDVRMSGSRRRNLRMFRRLCGPDALRKVFLVTTFWGQILDSSVGETRELELIETPEFWGDMVARGSRAVRYFGTRESALSIIAALLDSNRVTLQLQAELVDKKMPLAATAAGDCLLQDLDESKQRMRKELQALKREESEASQQHDPHFHRMLDSETRQVERRLQKFENEREKLARWEY